MFVAHTFPDATYINDKHAETACGLNVYCKANVGSSPNPQTLTSLHTEAVEQTHSLQPRTPLSLCVISCVRGPQPQLVKRVCELSSILSSAGDSAVRRFYPLCCSSVCIGSGNEACGSDKKGYEKTLAREI